MHHAGFAESIVGTVLKITCANERWTSILAPTAVPHSELQRLEFFDPPALS